MLASLIDELRVRAPLQRSTSEMAQLLSTAHAAGLPAGPLVSRSDGYTRTCAYRDELFEVLLLNWAAGAVSPLHDHGDQHCWMLVIDGRLRVDDYERLDAGEVPGVARVQATGSRVMRPGALDLRSGRFDLHRVSAGHDAPALSLHVYAGPLRKYLIYDESAQRCETELATYDEVLSVFSAPRA